MCYCLSTDQRVSILAYLRDWLRNIQTFFYCGSYLIVLSLPVVMHIMKINSKLITYYFVSNLPQVTSASHTS